MAAGEIYICNVVIVGTPWQSLVSPLAYFPRSFHVLGATRHVDKSKYLML